MKRAYYTFIFFLLAVLAASVGVWAAGAVWPRARAEVSIGRPGKVPIVAVDFGDVFYGQTAIRRLKLVNSARRSLSLIAATGCGCTRVRISNPLLPPGGRSAVRVSYSGIDSSRVGPATQQFLILSTGNRVVPELRGMVHATLLESLRFNRREINWRYVPGNVPRGSQTVYVDNVSGFPVKVVWGATGFRRFFAVKPMSALIPGGQKEKFEFRPSPSITAENRSLAEVIVMRGDIEKGEKPVRIKFNFDVYATPEPVLQAIPGALVVSRGISAHAITRIVELHKGPNPGGPVRVISVTTSSPSLHATLKQWSIVVALKLTPGQKLFQGDVTVAYSYNGTESTLDIPVFAASGLVGP